MILFVSHHVLQLTTQQQFNSVDLWNRFLLQRMILRILYYCSSFLLHFLCQLGRSDHLHRFICIPVIDKNLLHVLRFYLFVSCQARLKLNAFFNQFLSVTHCEIDDLLFLAGFRINSKVLEDLLSWNIVFLHGGSE